MNVPYTPGRRKETVVEGVKIGILRRKGERMKACTSWQPGAGHVGDLSRLASIHDAVWLKRELRPSTVGG